VNLAAGTYWLNMDNAVINDDPAYWDENSGPAQASENSVGTIPSEAFTIFGSSNGSSTVPEPASILLFGSGMLGLAGVLRRRLSSCELDPYSGTAGSTAITG
jgi:PEP-CTERM motif